MNLPAKQLIQTHPAATRPSVRRFSSPAVEAKIATISAQISDLQLRELFINCYPNTLDTTVFHQENQGGTPDTFVITGDIHALWLRDSCAQVWPYLPLAQQDPALARMIAGLIRRHTQCILLDPYANAFNDGPGDGTQHREWQNDHTTMRAEIHERKWELDSLCYAIRLAHGYWQTTQDASVFDADWLAAMQLTVATMKEQQRKTDAGPYRFTRQTHWQSDTLPCNGMGNPLKPVGLIASMFRPSDDACILPFLVPSNHFAVVSLRQLASLLDIHYPQVSLAKTCRQLADEVEAALLAYARVQHPKHGTIWAYEVDGFGNAIMMDDANVPSLLSLPYLGACRADDPLYRNTRRFILSDDNPWYFTSSDGKLSGVGSPHTLAPRIWPMSLIMRALTSDDADEIARCLTMLKHSDGGCALMHESFFPDDPSDFTRSWFAWANTLFGELILRVAKDFPALLQSSTAGEAA
ncbi:glycoside hydrolase family 125 protein [Deefgea salmonis]|uniref:Glycoside hydrolase family 125 protein n=1 Tax=Deefgea salmonis TaxID=2875502 RepID=A0ABS8BNX4_9NEIS|nr:glycoside hydrolase family 125 protein [Deefgea salmonis]MCB5197181.1 glycoside hydrolase family 125 protein [Deefgea salmonis]